MTGPARVPPGRHPNWCRCAGCRADIARFEAKQFNGTLAIAGVVIATGMIIWLGKVLIHAWHGRLAIGLAVAVLAGVAVMIVRSFTWLREDDPRPAIPPVPSSLPPPPPSVCVQPPACQHLNAVRVEDITDPERKRAVAYWCGQCETQLPGEFGRLMRPCCGTPPGERHLYNCPQAARG